MWVKLLSPLLMLATTNQSPAKNCHKCTNPCPPPAVEHEAGWKSGFELTAGFRWDREIGCPTLECPKPAPHQVDPFFLGLQQRLPLNEYFTLQGRIERDLIDHHGELIEHPAWNGAVQVNWAPWR